MPRIPNGVVTTSTTRLPSSSSERRVYMVGVSRDQSRGALTCNRCSISTFALGASENVASVSATSRPSASTISVRSTPPRPVARSFSTRVWITTVAPATSARGVVTYVPQ